MNVDITTLALNRAITVTEYAIVIEEQMHPGHEIAWSISTGKVSTGVMTLRCLTCQEEFTHTLERRRRRLHVKPYRGYGPEKPVRRRF
jgi:hypothetical protein